MVIEIAGNKTSFNYWSRKALCPMSEAQTKSIFCPKRDECTLPQVLVQAEDKAEAMGFALKAESDNIIPPCLNGKVYKVGHSFRSAHFQPSFSNLAEYLN